MPASPVLVGSKRAGGDRLATTGGHDGDLDHVRCLLGARRERKRDDASGPSASTPRLRARFGSLLPQRSKKDACWNRSPERIWSTRASDNAPMRSPSWVLSTD